MLLFVLLFCAFVEVGHHITTLFTNMTLPLPLLRVKYYPQSKNSNTLFLCIVFNFYFVFYISGDALFVISMIINSVIVC